VVDDQSGGLRIYDVSEAANPVEQGHYSAMSGIPSSIAVAGAHAYIGSEYDGFHVFDIADPDQPTPVGFLITPGINSGGPRDVAVSGTHAYLADSSAGLSIVDVSQPARPRLVSGLATPEAARAVSVVGDMVYVGQDDGAVLMVDVSVPWLPRPLASYVPPSSWRARSFGIAASGPYVHVAASAAGLVVLLGPTGAPPCPVSTILRGDPGRPTALRSLRRFRDEVLASSVEGRRYMKLFYTHASEGVRLLLRHPEIGVQARTVMRVVLPRIEMAMNGGSAKLRPADVEATESLLAALSAKASPRLREAIEMVRRDLHRGAFSSLVAAHGARRGPGEHPKPAPEHERGASR